jgi:hypothetical protein
MGALEFVWTVECVKIGVGVAGQWIMVNVERLIKSAREQALNRL